MRLFQPTLPARGATRITGDGFWRSEFQPTLPARGATPEYSILPVSVYISTHAPRTGSDLAEFVSGLREEISTHAPRTGSDGAFQVSDALSMISTHAPRTGSDMFTIPFIALTSDFNPRSPHGERQQGRRHHDGPAEFQPTLPARGATERSKDIMDSAFISTHAPRTGSDSAK